MWVAQSANSGFVECWTGVWAAFATGAVEEAGEQAPAELGVQVAPLSCCSPPETSFNEMITRPCQLPKNVSAFYIKNTPCPGNTHWAAGQACPINHWSKSCCTTTSALTYLEDQKRRRLFFSPSRVGNWISMKVLKENGKTVCTNVPVSQRRLMQMGGPKLWHLTCLFFQFEATSSSGVTETCLAERAWRCLKSWELYIWFSSINTLQDPFFCV